MGNSHMEIKKKPGGPIAKRPLHFFWIADCSGSMCEGGKIEALNNAIRDTIPLVQQINREEPNTDIFMRALCFSIGAKWHIPQTIVSDFRWKNLSANGQTDMGLALSMVAKELEMPPMPPKGCQPVLVLASDGQATDDFDGGLSRFLKARWAGKSIRMAVAIGKDADTDTLQRFVGENGCVLQANNPEALASYIKIITNVGTRNASNPNSRTKGGLSDQGNLSAVTQKVAENTPVSNSNIW